MKMLRKKCLKQKKSWRYDFFILYYSYLCSLNGFFLKAQRKKHDEEEALKMLNYEEKRRIEKEREDEELRQLKEKQVCTVPLLGVKRFP